MQTTDTQLLYSVFSGSLYEIPQKDIPLIQMGHLPLKKKPKSNCKECYDRRYTNRSSKDLTYPPCFCVQKQINFDILRELEKSYKQLSR
jgi:hypothetical protein